MIEVEGLTVTFGGLKAVDDVSFRVVEGEILGLVGPNGSGKSTILNALTGAVEAEGDVRLGERALRLGRPAEAARRGIARTFQTPQIVDDLSCLENVLLQAPDRRLTGVAGAWLRRRAMLRSERERWRASHEALERVGFADIATAEARSLTYGQRRFVELARVFVAQPSLVLLDEPAAGLNEHETHLLADLIRSFRDATVPVVVVEHKIDFIDALCDRLAVLEQGKLIAEGRPAEVWAQPAVIDAYLGVA